MAAEAALTSTATATYNPNRLFIASCIALITTAMSFAIRQDIADALGTAFTLDKVQTGWVLGAWSWGFGLSIIIGGPLVDTLGMRRILWLACVCHIGGVLATIFANGFSMLFGATVVMGLGNGMVEAVINPLTATVYADNKTHKLNVLHAWWPGGQMIGGFTALALGGMNVAWQIKFATIIIAAVVYGILIAGQDFPPTERVASGVSNAAMWREVLRPMFLLFLCCMVMTASTELGPDSWVGSVLKKTVGFSGTWVLVYTAGLMFVLRFFAGPLVQKISPLGVLLFAAVLSAIGLFTLGSATTAVAAFAAATVFGIGKAYFWPTMLGVTSELFPRGGSLLMGLMGGVGSISVGLVAPIMGKIYDEQGAGAAFRDVAILPVILIFVFGALFFYFRSIGGYKPVVLSEQAELAEHAVLES